MEIKDIIENFEFLDDWEEKYKYIIDLGEKLEKLDDNLKIDMWKVDGCMSQVWLIPRIEGNKIFFNGDSDATIVKGILYLVLNIFSGKNKEEISQINLENIFNELGLIEHLSPNRRNGLYSMIEKINFYAEGML